MPASDLIPATEVTRILSNQDLGSPAGDHTYVRLTEPTRGQKPLAAVVSHLYRENQDAPVQVHEVHVLFDDPANVGLAGPRWTPTIKDGLLTLTPGIQCECGWVGYLRNGAWESRGNVGESIPEA